MSPSFGRMALCITCLVGLSGAMFPEMVVPGVSLIWPLCLCPPVLVESLLQWSY